MTQYDDIIVTPIYGPLTTNNYPNVLPTHNLGVLFGKHPNPPQFYPSDNSSQFSNARHEYSRTATSLKNPYLYKNKYIAPSSCSLHTSTRKREAVGKSSFKQGLPYTDALSYKSHNSNDVKTALRVTRSGGCVANKKKGSIFNNVLHTGHINGWGSGVRNTY